MAKYRGFVQPNKRKVLIVKDLTLTAALEFLEDHQDGKILDEHNKELTKEELINVKSFRSLPGIGDDNTVARRATVSKDPDRELPKVNRDNTKSSSKRDS